MAETIRIRGEGGLVWEVDLPLPHGFEHRLNTGDLVQVDEDDNPIPRAEPTDPGPEDPEDLDPEDPDLKDPVDPYATPRPDDKALKPAWVTYAVSKGCPVNDANGFTTAELIEKYG